MSIKTFKSRLTEKFYNEKSNIKDHFKKVNAVVLTFDEWTSNSQKSYLTISCHYEKQNTLQSKNLAFAEFTGETSSSGLNRTITNILTDFGLDKKILSITSDNAANCLKAIDTLDEISFYGEKVIGIRCSAHTLNLIVKNSLKNFDHILNPIRSMIHSIRASHKKIKEFEELAKIKSIDFKKIKADVPTRWNYTLISLKRYLRFA